MIQRFYDFLGKTRFRLLITLFIVSGVLSFFLLIGFEQSPQIIGLQTALILIFIVIAALIIGSRLETYERWRWLAILAPAIGLVVLGVFFLPNLLGLFLGGAVGWIIAGWFLFIRSRAPMEYRNAVRFMRKGDYEQAVGILDGLIKAEPDDINHYRFRAELLRLWGKLGRAKRDYQKLTQMMPDSAIGYNGLSEIYLQSGELEEAYEAGYKAMELESDNWVAYYNLGMIEDRLKRSDDVIQHLNKAIELKASDSRHRLLIYLYLARANERLGKHDDANLYVEKLKQERSGLKEWQTILKSDQAETLRKVLEDDVTLADQVISGQITTAELA